MARKRLDKRVSLKIETELYEILERLALSEDRALNNLIRILLKESLQRRGFVIAESTGKE